MRGEGSTDPEMNPHSQDVCSPNFDVLTEQSVSTSDLPSSRTLPAPVRTRTREEQADDHSAREEPQGTEHPRSAAGAETVVRRRGREELPVDDAAPGEVLLE